MVKKLNTKNQNTKTSRNLQKSKEITKQSKTSIQQQIFTKKGELKKKIETLHTNKESISKEYINGLHSEFKKLNAKHPNPDNRHFEYILEKVCEKCTDINHDELLLLCDYCDDAFHTFCLDPPLDELPSEDEEWICPVCAKMKKDKEDLEQKQLKEIQDKLKKQSTKKRQTLLEEYFDVLNKINKSKLCKQCKQDIKDSNEQQDQCIKCQNYFHKKCFNTKKYTILCQNCENLVEQKIQTTEKNLFQFFCCKKYVFQEIEQNDENTQFSSTSQDTQQEYSNRLSSPVVAQQKKNKKYVKKKKPIFKLPKPSTNHQKLIAQKLSLARGLISKGMVFDDDLFFPAEECDATKNDASLEPSLQKLDKANLEILKQFKQMTRNGNYPPVKLVETRLEGFTVVADEDISKMTLIAEYVGEVDSARNRIFDDNDSIMDLLRTSHSSTSLVICPEKRGNLARFLNGINNNSKQAKVKQNVASVRYNVEGHSRVFLFACKNIKEGEVLYYDYNAGGFDEYPTENFV